MNTYHRSQDAAYGAAHAQLVATLEEHAVLDPYALASELLNTLVQDGWTWRWREPAPAKPREGIRAEQHEGWKEWRRRALEEIAAANARFEAERHGTLVGATNGHDQTEPATVDDDVSVST